MKKSPAILGGALVAASDAENLALVLALRHYVDGDLKEAQRCVSSIALATRVGIGGSNVERQLVDLLESACAESA